VKSLIRFSPVRPGRAVDDDPLRVTGRIEAGLEEHSYAVHHVEIAVSHETNGVVDIGPARTPKIIAKWLSAAFVRREALWVEWR
jgi:hypothetical protein